MKGIQTSFLMDSRISSEMGLAGPWAKQREVYINNAHEAKNFIF